MSLYQESFTGTNGTTPSGWTNRYNAVVIQGNQATGNTAFDWGIAAYTGQTFGSEQYAKVTVATLDGTRTFGVGVRCTGASTAGYWLRWNGSDTILLLRDTTTLQTISSTTLSAGDVLELRAVGTTLRAYKNGAQIGTDQTDVTYQNGTAGLWVMHTVMRLDDFVTGDLNGDWSYNAGTATANTADVYFDFENGNDADVVSSAILAASVHPNPMWGTLSRSGTFTSTTIETDGERALGGTVLVAGTTYTDSGSTRGMKRDHTQAEENVIVIFPQGTKARVSMGAWFYTTLTQGIAVGHTMSLFQNTAGTEFVAFWMQATGGGVIVPKLEMSSARTVTGNNLAVNTWYWVTLLWDQPGLTGSMELYDANLSKIGSTMSLSIAFDTPANRLIFGEVASHSDYPTGYSLWDDVMIDWTDGTFPLLPSSGNNISVNISEPAFGASFF